jgi:hypothetical protein
MSSIEKEKHSKIITNCRSHVENRDKIKVDVNKSLFPNYRSLVLYQPICDQYYSKDWKRGDENIWENGQKRRGFKDIHTSLVKYHLFNSFFCN